MGSGDWSAFKLKLNNIWLLMTHEKLFQHFDKEQESRHDVCEILKCQ